MSESELDRDVRVAIARAIRDRGAIPTIAAVAADLGRDPAALDTSFARLAEQRAFTARRGSREIHAFHPFCAAHTHFRIQADGRTWSAICGWDALGIPPALGVAGAVDTACGDCGEPIHVEVGRGGSATATGGAVLYIGVPAREFWRDIYFT